MATKKWRGDAPAVAQVVTLTVGGTVEATDIFNMTINGKTLSVVAGSTVLATVATTIATAWNASTIPEFAEITAAATSGGALTLTGDTAGKPFTVSLTTTETGGGAADDQTFGQSTTTACSGPNYADLAANWDGELPADSDDVVIDDSASDIRYGLDLSSVTPATIRVGSRFTGKIGLPVVNADNANGKYFEYRETYLRFCDAGDSLNTAVTIDTPSQRVRLSTEDGQATISVKNTGQAINAGEQPFNWKGTHASNSLTVSRGIVGVASIAGESATLLALNVGYQTNAAGDSTVICGSGVTLTDATIKQSGGSLELNSATSGTATITISDGVLTVQSGGQVGLSVQGGECVYNSTGTLGGNPVVSGRGHLNFSRDLRAKAVTNPVEVYGSDAKVSDPFKVVSSLVVDLNQTKNTENLDIGNNIRVTRGAVA